MSEVRRGRPPKAKVPTDIPKAPIVTGSPMPKAIPVRPTPVAEVKAAEPTPMEPKPVESIQTEAPAETPKAEPVAEVKAEPMTEVRTETPVESSAGDKVATIDDVKAELSEFLGKVKLLSPRNKDEMPAVCRISRGGRHYYLTIPQLPNSAIMDCWAIARGRMTGEECVAYIVSVLGISPPRLYSKYESIELD